MMLKKIYILFYSIITYCTLQYLFIECCNARFLDKTEIKIIKIQSPGHNAYNSYSKKRRYVYDQAISL